MNLEFFIFYSLLVELRAPTPSVGTPKPSRGEAADDDEPPLNEDDDDDLDDLEQGEEEPHTQHLVLAQFDKVIAVFYPRNHILRQGSCISFLIPSNIMLGIGDTDKKQMEVHSQGWDNASQQP